jgi:hypothetical protein
VNLSSIAIDGHRLGVGSLDALMTNKVPWMKIPTYYYDYKRLQLPLTQEECSDFFQGTIPIFAHTPGNTTTNAATGLQLNEAFLAVGVGIIAVGESESFTLSGISATAFPSTLEPTLPALDVGLTDPFLGANSPADAPVGLTSNPASFSWGGPTWKIVERFIQNYRLQILLNSRFEVTNESLFDLGLVWTFANNTGTSSSRIAAKTYIQSVNALMDEKDMGQTFMPANSVLIDDIPQCLPTPNPQVSYGHPNVAGVGNRIYSFPQPLLLVPGMRFQMGFVQASPQPSPTICDLATVGSGSYSPTLTEIPGCSSIVIPGGSVHFGVVMKGFALQPSAALHYLNNYLWRGSAIAQAINEDRSPWLGRLLDRGGALGKSASGALSAKPEEMVPCG